MDKKILLIADDVEMNRRVLRKFLKDEFEILEAEDGEQAMKLIHSVPIDILLLDIIMPVMDGLQVLEEIKDKNAYNFGILVATSTKEKTERTALALGADDIVSKPYDPIVIRKRLENVLAMKELLHRKKVENNDNLTAQMQEKKEKMSSQIEEAVAELLKISEIIKGNTENTELLSQAADNICKETEKISQALLENR